jgi:hypothetical protein
VLAASAVWSLAAASPAPQVPPAAAIQIEPAGPWSIDYGDFQCRLLREFQAGGRRTIVSLELEPVTATAWLKVAIQDKAVHRNDGKAVMLVDGEPVPGDLHYNIFAAKGFVMREFMLDLDRHRLGAIRSRLRLWTPGHGDIELRLGEFPAAWKALQACMADLNSELGIDTAQVAAMATAPQGSVFDFIDYSYRQESEFAFLYWVNAQGQVDDCRLLLPSGIPQLDKSLCANLKAKARFQPARNARGEPIRVPRFEHPHIRIETRRVSG